MYINIIINIIHILSYVVKISHKYKKLAKLSQFFYVFKNIFAFNFKTVIATNPGEVSFER